MDAFIGEIRALPYNFVPYGWLACQGQLVAIQTYQALYALIGTTYGGNGQSNFALPDLRGRVPVGIGQGPGLSAWTLGQRAGTDTVTLTLAQTPAHNHLMQAQIQQSGAPDGTAVAGPTSLLGRCQVVSPAPTKTIAAYDKPPIKSGTTLSSQMITAAWGNGGGGADPHNNQMPTMPMQFCINWDGVFPSFP